MKGEVIIFDPVANQQEQFMLKSEIPGSYMVTGIPSLALNKANQEGQYGDFSSHDVFAQSDWAGQDDVIGPSGVENWSPTTLSYNIFPTRSYMESESIDIFRKDGELRLLGKKNKIADLEGSVIHSKKYCDTFIAIKNGSGSIHTSQDGVTWQEDVINSLHQVYDYSPKFGAYTMKTLTVNIDSPGYAGYEKFKNLAAFQISNVEQVVGEVLPSASIEYDERGAIKIKVVDIENYGIGQSVRIQGTLSGGGVYDKTLRICGIEGLYIYLTDSALNVVGDSSGFESGTATGTQIIIEYEESIDEVMSGGGRIMYCKDAISVGFADLSALPTLLSEKTKNFAVINLNKNIEAAKGECTIAPCNVPITRGCGFAVAPFIATGGMYVQFTLDGGVTRNSKGISSLIIGGEYYCPITETIYLYTKDNEVFTDSVIHDDAILLYEVRCKIIRYAASSTNIYNSGTVEQVIDKRENQMDFTGTITVSCQDYVGTTDIDAADINQYREGNKFKLENSGGSTWTSNYRSIMEYEDGTVKVVSLAEPTIGASIKKKTKYSIPGVEVPTVIDRASNNSMVIGSKNYVYLFEDFSISSLYANGNEYGTTERLKIKLTECENENIFVSSITNDGENYFIGTKKGVSGSGILYIGSVFILSGIEVVRLPEFNGWVESMAYNEYQNALYVGTSNALYRINGPTSANRTITKIRDFNLGVNSIVMFKNGVSFVSGDNTYFINEKGLIVDLYDYLDSVSSIHVFGDGEIAILKNGDVIKTSNSYSNLAETGWLSSSLYYGGTPGLTKQINYAKVISTGLVGDASISLAIKTLQDHDWKYLPIAPGMERSTSKGAGYKSKKSDINALGEHAFICPPNVASKAFQYKVEIDRNGVTCDPGVTHVAVSYDAAEQKELFISITLNLSDILQDVNMQAHLMEANRKTRFLETIWKERRMIKLQMQDGLTRWCVPYAQPNDASNGFKISFENMADAPKAKKLASTLVSITLKAIYPLSDE